MNAPIDSKVLSHVYYFSIDSNLEAIATGGQGPSGERIYARYEEPAKVTTARSLYNESWPREDFEKYWPSNSDKPPELVRAQRGKRQPWSGLWGTISSGGDFALLRNDGVLQLDGRVTVLADDETLLDLVYHGLVEVPDELNELRIPVVLSLTIETASGPFPTAEGEDLGWINKRYLARQANFWRYEELTRKLFVAVGELTLSPAAPRRFPKRIQLKVFSVQVTGGK